MKAMTAIALLLCLTLSGCVTGTLVTGASEECDLRAQEASGWHGTVTDQTKALVGTAFWLALSPILGEIEGDWWWNLNGSKAYAEYVRLSKACVAGNASSS